MDRCRRENRAGPMIAPFLVIALSIAVFSSCASTRIEDYTILPPVDRDLYSEVIVNGVRIRARYLDDESLRDFLSRGGHEDLLTGIRVAKVIPFLVSVENASQGNVVYDSRATYFGGGAAVVLMPLDYTDVYIRLKRGFARKGILQGLKEVVLSGSITLDPGEGTEGIVLYDRPEAVEPAVTLVFDGIYIEGEVSQASYELRAVPRDEN